MARALASSLTKPQLDVRDRTYLASVVANRTGMSQADAEKRVDEAYAELKAAEQKARDAAEAARKTALIAAFLTAATLAIGCAAACAGSALAPVIAMSGRPSDSLARRGSGNQPRHDQSGRRRGLITAPAFSFAGAGRRNFLRDATFVAPLPRHVPILAIRFIVRGRNRRHLLRVERPRF